MTDCTGRLGHPDGLHCTREDGHDFGCTYEARWSDDAERDEE